MSVWLHLTLAALVLLGWALPATAQIMYRDAEGVPHFVDSLEQVPPQFKLRTIEKTTPSMPSTPSAASERPREVNRPRAAETPWVLWLFIAPRDPRLFALNKWSMFSPYDSKPLCLQAQEAMGAKKVVAEAEQIVIFTCYPAGVDPRALWELSARKGILLPFSTPLLFALAFALWCAWLLARPV
jgi:hypothetical protein